MSKLLITLFLMTPSYLIADTIEIFLKSDTTMTGINKAHEAGHTLVYYYLDGMETIEKQLAARATAQFQQEIDELVKQEGLQHLVSLNAFQRNQLLLKQLHSSGILLDSLGASLITARDREAIRHVMEEIHYASEQGVTQAMLPAIIFNGKLFKQTTDIKDVLAASTEEQE